MVVQSGAGGAGCVSFLREKYIEDGPANGGDGGTGGSVYIQAVQGHTSLHKLARKGLIKAGRGTNGQGKSQGGQRGNDVLIQVPVGTVVREISRIDPVAEEEERMRLTIREAKMNDVEPDFSWRNSKWILYPGTLPSDLHMGDMPRMPRPRRSNLAAMEPPSPINLDLSEPMDQPKLLIAGAMGGVGNPYFSSREITKPKFATKGEGAIKLELELELKLLADVGLVGLPNAGKSTLLRALTNSQTRIGNWAFTTLSPVVGTVVLDNNEGRPAVRSNLEGGGLRTHFTIADIPGLVEDAHLDKGLGHGFLRHIERAGILVFVVDLNAGDAVAALKNLWREVGEFDGLRNQEIRDENDQRLVEWKAFEPAPTPVVRNHDDDHTMIFPPPSKGDLPALGVAPMYAKPWFVVATKADLPNTQQNFLNLKNYIEQVEKGKEMHPGGRKNGWREKLCAIPVSAMNKQGTNKIAEWTAALLDR